MELICKSIMDEWSKGAVKNQQFIASQLEYAKLQATKITFADCNPQEAGFVRNILEIGALFSIETQDIKGFERYLSLLKVHYLQPQAEPSNKYLFYGLNLLKLLAQNRLAEFHIELELLPPDIIQSNPYINYPVLLEQYLMEGSYNKVFLAQNQSPSPHFSLFVDVLLNTIRVEIASCLETAFDSIKSADAARLLFLSSVDQLKGFCASAGKDWTLSKDGKITFSAKDTTVLSKVASKDIAAQIIEYATELEKIV